MAKFNTLAVLPKGVTFNLELTSPFACGGPQQGTADLPPLVLASQALRGKLNLQYNEPALPIDSNDIVKISLRGTAGPHTALHSLTLEGVSRTKVPFKRVGLSQMVRCYPEQQSPFLELVHVSCIGNAAISRHQADVHFSFVLPKVVLHRTDSPDDKTLVNRIPHWPYSSLPSSLSAEEVLTTDMNGNPQRVHAKITYTIRAQVFHRSVSMGSAAMTIRIFNDLDMQPPTCISDFPSEYQCRQLKPLRRHFCKTGTSVSATVTEPDPLVFFKTEDSASTMLPINFALNVPSQQTSHGRVRQVPEKLEVTFKWQLKSLTFLSAHPLTSMPTIKQARAQCSLTVMTVLTQPHQFKWTLASWYDHGHSSIDLASSLWTKTVIVPILLHKPTLPPPSMFTPFIARRYSLRMRVTVVGKLTGKTNLRLEVPVQIAYEQDKSNRYNTAPGADGDGDGPAPEDGNLAAPAPLYSP